jgi:hypothetical protein
MFKMEVRVMKKIVDLIPFNINFIGILDIFISEKINKPSNI